MKTALFPFFLFLCWTFSFAQTETATKSAVHPVFDSEETLKITLKGDLKALLKDKLEDRSYHKFTITYTDGEQSGEVPVRVKIRGNFRREMCKLAPFRLNFDSAGVAGSIFEGLNKVKMVLPCYMKSDKYAQFLAKEYLSYKGYNLITDSSFKVRLMETTFIDESGKYEEFTETTFLIEPVKLLAKRMGGKEIEIERVHPNSCNIKMATKMSVYQYLIGNTDWSIPALHNIKMIKEGPGNSPVAVPYDFDFTGLVGAPYAVPNPRLEMSSVKERKYRGYCQSEMMTMLVLDKFKETKAPMLALYADSPLLDKKTNIRAVKYLADFYRTLENEKSSKRVFLKTCRN
ncbi:MAG: hypothetical protein AAFY71_09710 [Bacteroidota bacterium]